MILRAVSVVISVPQKLTSIVPSWIASMRNSRSVPWIRSTQTSPVCSDGIAIGGVSESIAPVFADATAGLLGVVSLVEAGLPEALQPAIVTARQITPVAANRALVMRRVGLC